MEGRCDICTLKPPCKHYKDSVIAPESEPTDKFSQLMRGGWEPGKQMLQKSIGMTELQDQKLQEDSIIQYQGSQRSSTQQEVADFHGL